MRSVLLALRVIWVVAALVVVPALGGTAAHAHDSVKVTVTPDAVAPGREVKVRITGCEDPAGVVARSDAFVADPELNGRDGDAKTPVNGETKIKSKAKEGTYKVDVWCDGHDHRGVTAFTVDRTPKPKPTLTPELTPTPKSSPKSTPTAKSTPTPKSRSTPPLSTSPKPQLSKSVPNPDREPAPDRAPSPNTSAPQRTDAPSRPDDQQASPVAPVRAGGGGRTALAGDGEEAADEAGPGTPHTVIGLVLAGVAAVAVALRSTRKQRSAARDSD